MPDPAPPPPVGKSVLHWGVQLVVAAALCAGAILPGILGKSPSAAAPEKPPAARGGRIFVPTPAQLATFTIGDVASRTFQPEHATEGKIAVDEERVTPVFSPYSGRVLRLMARPGDLVRKNDVLFTVEATDTVQAESDLVAASAAADKARSQLQLARLVEERQRDLVSSKAASVKDLQAAQNDLVSAQNDKRSADTALEAARSRLRILGKSEGEIATVLSGGQVSAETPIVAPLSGQVTQRRIGPGQYVTGGSGDPPYTIGDLSGVWLVANVRESEAFRIAIGQAVSFRVLAFPDRVFAARVSFVAASVDPATRRVTVRAEVPNPDGALKPEMFASVRIATGPGQVSPAVNREAVIYEGSTARVWVVLPDGSVELRPVQTGLVDGAAIQVLDGLKPGERVVTRGSLFIDRLSTGDGS